MQRIHSPAVVMPVGDRWTCNDFDGPCTRSGHHTRPLYLGRLANPVQMHANCICTERAALARRVFVPTTVSDDDVRARMMYACKLFRNSLRSTKVGPDTPANTLAHIKVKRKLYEQAHQRLQTEGFSPKHSFVTLMVKADNLRDVGIEPKKPRAIQYRSLEFNLELMQYYGPVKNVLVRWKGPKRRSRTRLFTYANAESVAKLLLEKVSNFSNPIVVSFDAKSFDASVRTSHLEMVDSIYQTLLPNAKFGRLLRMRHNNRCASKHGLRYTLSGNRLSGDVDTALGNSMISALICTTIAHETGADWDALINGDDVWFISNSVTCQDVKRIALGCGFTMEAHQFIYYGFNNYQLTNAYAPLCVNGVWRMVRPLSRVLSSFGSTHRFINAHARYLKGVAMCELHASRGLPVVQALCLEIIRRVQGKAIFDGRQWRWGDYVDIDDLDLRPIPVSDAVRCEYALISGISVDSMREYEAQIPDIVEAYLKGPWEEHSVVATTGSTHWNDEPVEECVLPF